MFFDALQLDNEHTIEADICIVGAGAAGITMAREFIGSSTRVALLESGAFAYAPEKQALYHGDNIGMPSFDLHVNRLRFFGGTTNHWAGHCRPLDPIDFEKRDWVPHSGWPLNRNDLEPYYKRSQPIVGLGSYEYENLAFWQKDIDHPALDVDENRLKTVVYNQSPPTRFGVEYRQELEDAKNVSVYINASVLEIITNEDASQVTALYLTSDGEKKFTARAKIYILAAGGMENARLLLLSNRVNPSGLGNENDLVGRYFMDHLLLRPGVDISFSAPETNLALYHKLFKLHASQMFAILASPDKLLRAEQLNNFRIHLVRRRTRYNEPMGRIFSQIDKVEGSREKRLDELPVRQQGRDSISLHLVLEPMPNPDSQITLSNKLDYFGQRKINVNWQTRQQDIHNAYRAMELAAMEFGRLGLGRAYGEIFQNSEAWPKHMEAGKHHCGTTRMTDNPKTGVVNSDCRVNSVDNLYIAGSSVFPTIGYANPTLTIIALALRLVEHTRSILTNGGQGSA